MVANGGLRVTTTLDMDFQRLAERCRPAAHQPIDPAQNLTNAALVAMKPGNGEILAMLGSVDYQDEVIDGRVNVTLSPQQPGSAIKPLTYAAALSPVAGGPGGGEPRWTAADILWDVPVEYEQFSGEAYAPENYDGAVPRPGAPARRPRQQLQHPGRIAAARHHRARACWSSAAPWASTRGPATPASMACR